MASLATISTKRRRTRQLGGKTAFNRYKKYRKKARKWLLGENERALCAICGNEFRGAELTLDHIIPRRLGGKDELSNFQLLCLPCHTEKSAKELKMNPPKNN